MTDYEIEQKAEKIYNSYLKRKNKNYLKTQFEKDSAKFNFSFHLDYKQLQSFNNFLTKEKIYYDEIIIDVLKFVVENFLNK